MHHNRLTSLPPEIGQLTALTELYLDRNQLTSLPLEITNLTAMTWLYLRDNPLETHLLAVVEEWLGTIEVCLR